MKNKIVLLLSDKLERSGICTTGTEAQLSLNAPGAEAAQAATVAEAACKEADMLLAQRGLDPESQRGSALVCPVFRGMVGEGEQQAIVAYLKNKGYSDVQPMDMGALTAATYGMTGSGVMLAERRSPDVVLALYGKGGAYKLGEHTLAGKGVDEQLRAFCRVVWNKMFALNPNLNEADVAEQIEQQAQRFIASGSAEATFNVEGAFGFTGSCRMTASEISAVATPDLSGEFAAVKAWARKAGMASLKTCTLVVGNGLGGVRYFEDMMRSVAAEVADVVVFDGSQEQELLRRAMSDGGSVGIANSRLPKSSIKIQMTDMSAAISVLLPEDIDQVRIMKDGALLKALRGKGGTTVDYKVEGLTPDTSYTFGFVAVKTDDTGGEHLSAPQAVPVKTRGMNKVISLLREQGRDVTTFSWEQPAKGEIKLFVSRTPFNFEPGSRISLDSLDKKEEVDTVDRHYRLPMDFCGSRWVLPVQFIDGAAYPGEEEYVVADQRPVITGLDAATHTFGWDWRNIDSVRIKWVIDGKEEHAETIQRADCPNASFRISGVPATARILEVEICSIGTDRDGHDVQSLYVPYGKISVEPLRVDYDVVRKKKLFGIMQSNDYEITVSCGKRVPQCDLLVLVEESNDGLSRPREATHSPSLIIPAAELRPMSHYKATVTVNCQKGNKLCFVLTPAASSTNVRVVPGSIVI